MGRNNKTRQNRETEAPWANCLWHRFLDPTLSKEQLDNYQELFKGLFCFLVDENKLNSNIVKNLTFHQFHKYYAYVKDETNKKNLLKIINSDTFKFDENCFLNTKEELLNLHETDGIAMIIYYDDSLKDDFPLLFRNIINKYSNSFYALVGKKEEIPLIYRLCCYHYCLENKSVKLDQKLLHFCIDVYLRLCHLEDFDLKEYLYACINENCVVPTKYKSLLPECETIQAYDMATNKVIYFRHEMVTLLKRMKEGGYL